MSSVTTGDGLEHVRYLADTIGKRADRVPRGDPRRRVPV